MTIIKLVFGIVHPEIILLGDLEKDRPSEHFDIDITLALPDFSTADS